MPAPTPLNNKKEPCATLNCRRIALSTLCSRRLCPQCCRSHSTPCGNKGHFEAYLKVKAAHESAASDRQHAETGPPRLSHPKPVAPPINPEPVLEAAEPVVAVNEPAEQDEPIESDGTPGTVATSVTERRMQKNMEPPFDNAWQRAKRERNARLEAVDQKLANQRALIQTVILVCWLTDGIPAIEYPIQNVATWPTLNLAQLPTHLDTLGLSPSETIEVYGLSSFRWQRHSVDHVYHVKTNDILLIRRLGVVVCPDIEANLTRARCARSGGSLASLSPALLTTALHAPLQQLKRPRTADEDTRELRPPCVARTSLAQRSPFASSSTSLLPPPQPSPSTISPHLAHVTPHDAYNLRTALATPREPYTPLAALASSSSIGTSPPGSSHSGSFHTGTYYDTGYIGDTLGLGLIPGTPSGLASPSVLGSPSGFLASPPGLGAPSGSLSLPLEPFHPIDPNIATPASTSVPSPQLDATPEHAVHIPLNAVAKWPHGMYARDIALGFGMVAALKGDDLNKLENKFAIIFPGVKYVHTTVNRQFRAWKLSTQAEREALLTFPRSEAGLWTTCRKTLSGWPLSRSQKQG